MMIPYGTDKDDGFVGFVAIAIVLLCVLGFGLTWPREAHLQDSILKDSVQVWAEQAQQARDSIQALAPHVPTWGQETSFDTLSDPTRDPSDRFNPSERAKAVMLAKSPLRAWGLHPGDASWFPGLITHMFLHAGWMHLIGNMFFFFAFGVAMERRFGWKAFIFLYLAGGVFAAVCESASHSTLHHALPTVPMVGASGAIAAVMGAFLRSYPKSKIKMFFWIWRPFFANVYAWFFLGSWIALQLLYNHFVERDQEGGTAYMAHISGFLFGFVAAQFLPVDPEVAAHERPTPARPSAGILSGFEPMQSWQTPQREERSALELGWDSLRLGTDDEARPHFTRQFSDWAKGSDTDLANIATQLEKLLRQRPDFRFDPLPSWEWGTKLSDTEHRGAAIEFLRMALDATPPLPPAMASRAEQILERLKPPAPEKLPPPPRPQTPPPPGPRPPPPSSTGRPSWLVD